VTHHPNCGGWRSFPRKSGPECNCRRTGAANLRGEQRLISLGNERGASQGARNRRLPAQDVPSGTLDQSRRFREMGQPRSGIVMSALERFFMVMAFVGIAGMVATIALSMFVGS